jgi:hypothetical protein
MTPKSAVTASNMATILRPSVNDLTVQIATQSKEFREELNFESLMMILCNRLRHMGAIQDWQNRGCSRPANEVASSAARAFAAAAGSRLALRARQKADPGRQSAR